MFRILVKGSVSGMQIASTLHEHGSHGHKVTIRGVTTYGETVADVSGSPGSCNIHNALSLWFCREASHEAPFPAGSLLHYGKSERQMEPIPLGEYRVEPAKHSWE